MNVTLSLISIALTCCFFATLATRLDRDASDRIAQKNRHGKGLVGHFTFSDLEDQERVRDSSGSGVTGYLSTTGGAARKVSLYGQSNTSLTSAQFFGNASGTVGMILHHNSKIDHLSAFTFAFVINYFYGDTVLLQKGGEDGIVIELYRQMIKVYIGDMGGKIEYTWYPNNCSYLPPGLWSHVAVTYNEGQVNLFMNGEECGSIHGARKPLSENDKDLTSGTCGGLLSDLRIYNTPLSLSEIKEIWTPSLQDAYRNCSNFQEPSSEEITRRGLGFINIPVTPSDMTMYHAWLNFENPPNNVMTAKKVRIEIETKLDSAPLVTAINELSNLVVPHSFKSTFRVSQCKFSCPELRYPESFRILVSKIDNVIGLIGRSGEGVLQAYFHIARKIALGNQITNSTENPSSAIRCLNMVCKSLVDFWE
eukprot:UC4_evm1s665